MGPFDDLEKWRLPDKGGGVTQGLNPFDDGVLRELREYGWSYIDEYDGKGYSCICGSNDIEIVRLIIANGGARYPIACHSCKKRSQIYLKKDVGELLYQRTEKARGVYDPLNTCSVCGDPYSELHHWAPRHLFGEECERWPKARLCRSCHQRWHRLVTPNMGSKRNET